MPPDPDAEILLEYSCIGNAVEVRVISASDGREVSFAAPANTSQADIERLARAKLGYVRRKEQGSGSAGGSGGGSDGRGGVIV